MDKVAQTPLSRTARLLDLVPYLSSHQGIELSTLAKVFGVTQPQMVSDLTTLWMCGLPGYTPLELMDLSFDSGFVTITNAQTLSKPRNLNDDETIALLLGLDLVMESLPPDRDDLRELGLELLEKLSIRSGVSSKLSAIPAVAGSLRAQINLALTKKLSLEMVYHSMYSDTVSTRIVQPLELRIDSGVEYLVGACSLAAATRVFRLDRIQSLTPVENNQSFEVGPRDEAGKGVTYTIKVHSRPRAALERFSLSRGDFSAGQSVSAFSSEWALRSALASSGSVEVLEPAHLRAQIAASAQSILQRYL